MYKIFLIVITCFANLSFAKINIACTHLEVCRLINMSAPDAFNTKILVLTKGDPHEFEPSIDQIKELLNADILISGPLELNPWMKKIYYQRLKNIKLVTFSLKIHPAYIQKYGKDNLEALSHFWLYPDVFCDMKNQMINWIKNQLKIQKIQNACNTKDIELKLTNVLSKTKSPIILSHDALYPLFKAYKSETLKVIPLKGSGHHDEVSPDTVKGLYNILKEKKVIWILEKNINIPANILSKVRPTDKVIEIETGISSTTEINSDFPVLSELIKELNNL